MAKATLIFLIPGYQKGTIWETEQIITLGYLSKTVFIAPAGSSSSFGPEGHWIRTKQVLQNSLGLRLPDFAEGLMFKFDAEGNAHALSNIHKIAYDADEKDAFYSQIGLQRVSPRHDAVNEGNRIAREKSRAREDDP